MNGVQALSLSLSPLFSLIQSSSSVFLFPQANNCCCVCYGSCVMCLPLCFVSGGTTNRPNACCSCLFVLPIVSTASNTRELKNIIPVVSDRDYQTLRNKEMVQPIRQARWRQTRWCVCVGGGLIVSTHIFSSLLPPFVSFSTHFFH